MRIPRFAPFALPLLLLAVMLTPPATWAQSPAPADAVLSAEGSLAGQLVDRQGRAAAGREVQLRSRDTVVAVARSDAEGRFLLTGVRGGVYTIHAVNSSAAYRLWTSQAAPPHANREVLLITGDDAVRGQNGPWYDSPWLFGAVTGAVITAPLVLENDDQPSGS